MTSLMVCDICWSLWGKAREIKSMGSGGPCCVCGAERPCAGPIYDGERKAMLAARGVLARVGDVVSGDLHPIASRKGVL